MQQLRTFRKIILAFGILVSGSGFFGCKSTPNTATPQPVVTASFPRDTMQVEVEHGDTLNSIAKQFDTDWRDIVRLNRVILQNGLRVGQVLTVIPGKEAVTAMRGDGKANQFEELLEDEETEDFKFVPKNRGLLFGGNKSKEEVDFMWPMTGRVTSHFGKRGRRMHKGIDIAANVGTPIRAASGGEVIFSGRRKGYGGTVVVDHGGFISLYAHCSAMIAKVGDTVRQGDVIAKSGRTGNARGAHLHFEIRDAQNRPLDPETLLRQKAISQWDRSPTTVFNALIATAN